MRGQRQSEASESQIVANKARRMNKSFRIMMVEVELIDKVRTEACLYDLVILSGQVIGIRLR